MKYRTMLAIIVLAVLPVPPVWADDEPLEVHQQGNISYVSGGIGEEESEALQSIQHNYNLRVMNADKFGHFSGDIHIEISDLRHNVLLETVGGPLFYVNLPKGRYIVKGFSKAQSKKQKVTIVGKNPVHVHFVWPQDTTDINNY